MKMNGIDLFKNDHQRILVLINELTSKVKQTGNAEQESDYTTIKMFNELRETLIQHIKTEERMLFPELESFIETRIMVDECYREYKRIRTTVEKIDKFLKAKLRDGWDDLLLELEEKLQVELVREEDWLFPMAKERLGDAPLEEMFLQIARIRSNQSVTDNLIVPAERFGTRGSATGLEKLVLWQA